jgi:hypothetical protein
MAVSCLVIEAIESFRQGWPDTHYKSKKAFKQFFKWSPHFKFMAGFEEDFYENIRCGILHQGETGGGWRIWRSGNVFDKEHRIINASIFHHTVEKALNDYCDDLRSSEWDTTIWENFRKKMDAVIANCSSDTNS